LAACAVQSSVSINPVEVNDMRHQAGRCFDASSGRSTQFQPYAGRSEHERPICAA
jgi:hypothetical protein